MRAILRLMIGELNSSHSGVSAPAAAGGAVDAAWSANSGSTFDRAAYEKSGKLKITEVLPHSPAELAKIQVGEELRAVDGVAIGPHVNLDEQLQHKIDKRVVLDISGRAGDRAAGGFARRADLSQVGGGQSRLRGRRSATTGWATCTCATCRSRR